MQINGEKSEDLGAVPLDQIAGEYIAAAIEEASAGTRTVFTVTPENGRVVRVTVEADG